MAHVGNQTSILHLPNSCMVDLSQVVAKHAPANLVTELMQATKHGINVCAFQGFYARCIDGAFA